MLWAVSPSRSTGDTHTTSRKEADEREREREREKSSGNYVAIEIEEQDEGEPLKAYSGRFQRSVDRGPNERTSERGSQIRSFLA